MIQKKIKPITSSQRQTIYFYKNLIKSSSIKKLTKGFQKANGRNNQGKITVRHRGGGHKRLYRFISFNRKNIEGYVKAISYDPNRSASIAQIYNKKLNQNFYILAPDNLKINTYIQSGCKVELISGNALPIKNIPIGDKIHNISLTPFGKGKLIRSAGTYAELVQKNEKYAKIRLISGERRLILLNCFATLGIVSNLNHKKIKLGKAGRSRWLNWRPHVRGVAMNPVDHPHGGGEGKTSGGRPSVTPQGKITKGQPTRLKRKKNRLVL
jgi:large subunit ribosomal protein L2